MATFTNKATLSFTGGSVDSNTVTGEILEVLSAEKTAIPASYGPGDEVTYVISMRNSGPTALTGLSLSDNLGAYTIGDAEAPLTLYPLSYVEGSVAYYVNGVLQSTPAVTAGPPLVITGLSVPAAGNGILIYKARVNSFAPMDIEATVTNVATISGGVLSTPVTVTETISAESEASLSITKSLYPTTVPENGQLTYTFTIQNTGNTPALPGDNLVVTDTFDPVLDPIAVSYNGAVWTEGVNYTYDRATGAFATLPGQISVDAASYTQNPDGSFTVSPGVSTLVVSGTV